MAELSMPTVDLEDDALVRIEGGDVVTWAECKRRALGITHTPKHEATDAMGMESRPYDSNRESEDREMFPTTPTCQTCRGFGTITIISGQTAESYDERNEDCPDCVAAEQSASSPVEGEVIAAARELLDACYTADANSDLSDFIDGSLLTRLDKALSTRSVAVSSEAVAEAEGALKGIAGNETFMRRNKVSVSAWALASLLNQARKPEGAEPAGCAEVEVGRAVYERIEALMVRKPVPQSSDAAELDYLSHLAESVEEVGGYDGPLRPFVRTPMDREAVAAFLKERDQSVEPCEASDEERLESAEAILGLVSAHPAHEAGEVETLKGLLREAWASIPTTGPLGERIRAALEDKS